MTTYQNRAIQLAPPGIDCKVNNRQILLTIKWHQNFLELVFPLLSFLFAFLFWKMLPNKVFSFFGIFFLGFFLWFVALGSLWFYRVLIGLINSSKMDVSPHRILVTHFPLRSNQEIEIQKEDIRHIYFEIHYLFGKSFSEFYVITKEGQKIMLLKDYVLPHHFDFIADQVTFAMGKEYRPEWKLPGS